MSEESDGEISKTQAIRVLDVIAIGPLMIYAGMKAKNDLPTWARFGLIGFGISTIGYNLMNLLEQEKVKEERVKNVQAALEEQFQSSE